MNEADPASEADLGFAPEWLALREPADAAARSPILVERLRPVLGEGPLVVHDIGAGTGSMARWLAPRLPQPQRWVLHDHDPALLAVARTRCAGLRDAAGAPVAVHTRRTDLARLGPTDLAGPAGNDDPTGHDDRAPDLITASALLDLLTADELDRLLDACAAARCPLLLTLSVLGRVELEPPEGEDRVLAAAFDAHQRRTVHGRGLLGPDAPDAAAAALRRRGMVVHVADSPWRLGPGHAALFEHWLRGWVAAAVAQQPELADRAAGYLHRRLRPGSGVHATVWHRDLLGLIA